MNDAAARFMRRIVIRRMLVALATFAVIVIFAPRLLGIDPGVLDEVLLVILRLSAVASVGTALVTFFTVRRHRRVANAIAAGSRAIAPEDIGRLANLPTALAVRTFALSAGTAALILAPGIRPERLDDGRAISLFILIATILGAAAIPNYVLSRQVTIELIELAPLEPLMTLLETLELKQAPWRQLTRWVLLATVTPVALMSVGAVLVVHAHFRTHTEESRRATAVLLARTALEGGEAPLSADASEDAIVAATEFGFIAHDEPGPAPDAVPTYVRESDGQLAVSVPLERGHAVIRFTADLSPEDATYGVVVGLVAVLVAALFGGFFGRVLADDLLQATRSVRLLGTESVLRGATSVLRPARFAVVESLGRGIDALTQRFRVFAAAQERALEARAAAHRMRSLLYASVSHDLKSPLNAILGFADLVSQEPLTAAQRESLTLIHRRGRELLALIETILDAARVEAGQLTLVPRSTPIRRLVTDAIVKARELAGDAQAPFAVQIADDLPDVPVDPSHVTRAIAVIVAHAIRTAAADTPAKVVRIRAAMPADHGEPGANPDGRGRVVIDIEHGSRDVTREELTQLFARISTSRGRGLTLGLSLARSVIEIHGGGIEIDGASDGAPVCRVWLPVNAPGKKPKLSARPALG